MKDRPLTVNATFAFILLNIIIWLALGIIIAVEAHPALPDIPIMKGIIATLSLVIAGLLIVLFLFIYRRNRTAYYLTLAFFAVTSVLTIIDEVGISDIVVLVINIIPIVLLIKDRNWYLQVKANKH